MHHIQPLVSKYCIVFLLILYSPFDLCVSVLTFSLYIIQNCQILLLSTFILSFSLCHWWPWQRFFLYIVNQKIKLHLVLMFWLLFSPSCNFTLVLCLSFNTLRQCWKFIKISMKRGKRQKIHTPLLVLSAEKRRQHTQRSTLVEVSFKHGTALF